MSRPLMPGPETAPPVPEVSTLALLLDVDGTLVELAPSPERVAVPPWLPVQLERLRRACGGALALVSGRSLESLDRLLSPLRLDAVGLHGGQWRCAGDSGSLAPAPPALALVAAEFDLFAAAHPGVSVENKGLALALHTRQAPRWREAAARIARVAQARLGPGYRLQEGSNVVELLPVAATKGNGIARLMTHPPFAGRSPVFVGDDLTDESGFAQVAALGGWGILVGTARPTAARHRLASVDAVHLWLDALERGQPTLTPGALP